MTQKKQFYTLMREQRNDVIDVIHWSPP